MPLRTGQVAMNSVVRVGLGNGAAGTLPGFDQAAEQLGVTVDELMAALGEPPFDLNAAATTLGVTLEELREALPPPPQQQPGPPPQE
ncbi:MAG: hypothetical protein AAGG51_30645 [Cyanobacteria bacterium P01_G01_bin.54]